MRVEGRMPSKGTFDGLNMYNRLRLIEIAVSCRERAKSLCTGSIVHMRGVHRESGAISAMRWSRARSMCDPMVPYKSIASGKNSM